MSDQQQANPFLKLADRYGRGGNAPVLFAQEVLGVNPDPWEVEFLQTVADPKLRRVSVRSGHGVGKGKCVDEDCLIPCQVALSPDGHLEATGMKVVRWGDIKIGDYVFGADGVPTRVIATNHYRREHYRVTFDDRSSVVVSGEHEWLVKGRQDRRKGLGWRLMETQGLIAAGVKRSNGANMARQWEIPIQGAVRFAHVEGLPLDPYVMGVWLGDGSRGVIAKDSPAVREKLAARHHGGVTARSNGRSVGITKVNWESDPVFACRSWEKYIPDAYKYAGVAQRRALFEGLMDGDGEVQASGSCGYSSSSERLLDDVVWLARSLGYKAMKQEAVKQPRYRDGDGNLRNGRLAYRATIQVPDNPFTHEERRAAFKPASEERYLKRWIDSIEPVGLLDGMCITVEAKDSLYLTDDFHVTHNSSAVAMASLWHLIWRVPGKVVMTAPTSAQLFDALFSEVKRMAKQMKEPFASLIEVKADRIELKSRAADAFISCRTSRAEQPEALAGVHSPHVLLIADEASGVPEAVFESAAGSMSGHSATTILTGNPTRNTGLFYDTHHRLRGDWYTMHVSCIDSPRVSDDFVAEMKLRYGEDSPAYHVRVLGNFPPAEDDTVIPVDLIEHAMHNEVRIDDNTTAIWGLDVARHGNDSSVLCKRQGPVVHPLRVWGNLDLMQLTGAVKVEYDTSPPHLRPAEIIVDSIGLGAGVLDRLRELGLPARGLNVSERAASNATYINTRAELWFKAKEWLENRDVSLPRDEQLFAELASPRYSFTSTGKIQVESKESIKKRGLKSPDRADAVCLCLATDHTTMAYGTSFTGGWKRSLRRNIRGIV